MNAVESKTANVSDVLSIFEGLKSWISMLERSGCLGKAGFHDELLGAFFQFAFDIGYLGAAGGNGGNTGNALEVSFRRFTTAVSRSLRSEVFGASAPFPNNV